MILTMGGKWCFRQIGKNPPYFVQWMGGNKYYTMIAFFIIRSMANQLLNTGAFEVYIDGDLVRQPFPCIPTHTLTLWPEQSPPCLVTGAFTPSKWGVPLCK